MSTSLCRYTSGGVRLWDTQHWDSGTSYFRPTHANTDVTDAPNLHISHVQVNKMVAAAAFEDGKEGKGTDRRVEALHIVKEMLQWPSSVFLQVSIHSCTVRRKCEDLETV